MKYLVVGGIAAIAHGVPRATFDVDVAVWLTKVNLDRLAEAMRRLHFKPRASVDVTALADPRVRREWTVRKSMKVFSFSERHAPFRVVDVMVKPLNGFARLYRQRLRVLYRGVSIPVLPMSALVQMKRAAARPQDRTDVQFLEAVRKIRRRRNTR